jgi:hypothetical protein
MALIGGPSSGLVFPLSYTNISPGQPLDQLVW